MSAILLVEADGAAGDALAEVLRPLGHAVLATQTADAAIEILRRTRIDVLVCDLRARTTQGVELLQHCINTAPQTRVVLVSADATAAEYKAARAKGVVEVLGRPIDVDELKRAITRAEGFTAGFQADVVGLSLIDLLQVFHHNRRSVTVRVGRVGAVHLRDGNLIHAQTANQTGADALLALLQVERGVLATGPLEPVTPTLNASFQTVLLGTHLDEQRARGLQLDPERIERALASTGPAHSPLAIAVAASTPPVPLSAPRVTDEVRPVAPEPVYLLETRRAAPSPLRPDYWLVGGISMLFIATLVLTLFRPAPRLQPAAAPPVSTEDPRRGEVINPYRPAPPISAVETAPASVAPISMRVEPAAVVSAQPVSERLD